MTYKKIDRMLFAVTVALMVYMPFHVFLSQSSSLVTGGLEIWKAAKDVVLYALALACFVRVVQVGGWSNRFFRLITVAFIAYAALHGLLVVSHSENSLDNELLGCIYNLRFEAAFMIGYYNAVVKKQAAALFARLAVYVATLVAVLGVFQYFTPRDLLSHFGYSIERGVKPNFFIDDKPDLPRVMSVMRDPNTLGAFLLLPFSLYTKGFGTYKDRRCTVLAGTAMLLCLWLTFSRSAWLGLIIVVLTMVLILRQNNAWRLFTKYRMYLLVAIVFGATALYAARGTYVVQNTLLHADKSTVQRDSNELRLDFTKNALSQIKKSPFGHGAGTAGLVSIRNSKAVVLTEDYYLQIAYEVGVGGLLLFMGILYLVAMRLWALRLYSDTAMALLASLAALSFINLLLHMWSGEAVVLYWWLLAGAASVPSVGKKLKRG